MECVGQLTGLMEHHVALSNTLFGGTLLLQMFL